jgi:hypothetical protein
MLQTIQVHILLSKLNAFPGFQGAYKIVSGGLLKPSSICRVATPLKMKERTMLAKRK